MRGSKARRGDLLHLTLAISPGSRRHASEPIRRHLRVSLFPFTVGIEMGQLLVLTVMLPAIAVVLRYVIVGRIGIIILSAVVAHAGSHWMTERGDLLLRRPPADRGAPGVSVFGSCSATRSGA